MKSFAVFARQLHAELPQWVAQGWISAAQAEQLAAQYPLARADGAQRWHVLLSVLAALCVGGGVIALFAANWHALSRPMRVALSLAPLLLSQGAFLYARFRKPQSTAWREASALAVGLAVGASIALVAQTYHIEAQDMFLRTWLWLVLPLPYLTGSWASAFWAAFLVHVFGASEATIFPYAALPPQWEYWAYLAALLPWLLQHARRGAGYNGQTLVWRAFVNTHALMTLGVLLLLHGAAPLPTLLLLASAYVCAQAWCASSAMNWALEFALGVSYLLLAEMVQAGNHGFGWLLLYAAPLLLAALWRATRVSPWSWCFAVGVVLLFWLRTVLPEEAHHAWTWGVTFAVIALGIWQLRMALEEERFLAINAAFVWILAALYWRFVDANIPLVFKGIAFIAAGVGLFALNRYVAKRRAGVTHE